MTVKKLPFFWHHVVRGVILLGLHLARKLFYNY